MTAAPSAPAPDAEAPDAEAPDPEAPDPEAPDPANPDPATPAQANPDPAAPDQANPDPVAPWVPISSSAMLALAGRPGLWWPALGALLRLAPPGWWRRRPFLPLPAPELWAFRMVTAYGRPDVVPEAGDLISFLEWCRATRGWGGRAGSGRSGRLRPNPLTGPQSG